MHENILTIAMLVVVIMICMLYCACFVFPVVIAGIGISDVKKQRKKVGYILLSTGVLLEIIVIAVAAINIQ